jgi:fatty-acyl-CoA synthase
VRLLRLYERVEAAAALALAATPTPEPPHRIASALPALLRWRRNPAGLLEGAAARHGRRTAVIDDEGSLTYAELDARTSALARTWEQAGIARGTSVGILCGNHRLFLEATNAAHKLGCDIVYLNTGFSAPQVAEVVHAEGVDVLVYDDEHAPLAARATPAVAVTEAALNAGAQGDARRLKAIHAPGRVVVLTSGTTGRPKGAARRGAGNPLDTAGVLACIPFMSGDTTVVAAPLFHGLGLFASGLATALGSTIVVRRRFDPEETLRDIGAYGAEALVVVPVMLQRILALPPRVLNRYDTSTLRILMCSGAALSGDLANRALDRFGDVVYNVYGSTEVALATIAGPRDLRAAPGTVGRPTPGVTVKVLDGRVMVGSSLRMDGYTGGGYKDRVGNLVATGDLGHYDRWGRLYIDGREDDMIVSGGENVFPAEVEETLARHPDVLDVAVIGVSDAAFGQRLKAFVVRAEGSTVTEDELCTYVHDRLARFKTPREVVFLDELPRTATGKVLKRLLEAA